MNSDYSFIINKPIDYSCLDSTNQHISNSNYILKYQVADDMNLENQQNIRLKI